MHYIIGTAGHIDHGKTSLVKALTGQDTDRLKEEKERGISIDLGFAYLDLPGGRRAGVVDVPGHERFIRNMLAGAHGIDLVLFTVAADDGVMPQTEEHLDIVHLLGVERAVFVITKADLVSEARIREVEEEIEILTAGTTLADSPVIAFSSVTGQGLEPLRTKIAEILERYVTSPSSAYFRLPVDRVFVLQGHGVVVTGTAVSGEVSSGARVRCLPGDQQFRVRSLQVHNDPVEAAGRGQRIALNVAGPDRPSIERGQVICDEKLTKTTDRFDAFVEVRPAAAAGVKNHQHVRVYLGTAERLGTLILLHGAGARDASPQPKKDDGVGATYMSPLPDKIAPKQSAYCQLALSEPVLALRGDRFIIRDETAQRTLGGGVVLHPWARKHKRADTRLPGTLRQLHEGDPATLVEIFLGESDSFALPIGPLYQFLNLQEDAAEKRLEQMPAVRVFDLDGEKLYAAGAKWQDLTTRVVDALRDFHVSHPLAPGMEMEQVRDRLPGGITTRLFRACVEQLEAGGAVVRDGSRVRLPGHQVKLRDEERTVADRVTALLAAAPFLPPDVKQIEREIGIARARLDEVLRVMERERSVVRVSAELYFLSGTIDRVKSDLARHLSERSEITPATFRDLFGTSRKYAIPLLEYLDREGVTVRVGDSRRLKRPAVAGGTGKW